MPHLRRCGGFTLIEMLIAVVVIGLLAAVALPNFLGQSSKARTTEATAMLSSIATAQGEYRFKNPGSYLQVGTDAPLLPPADVFEFQATATRGLAAGSGTNTPNRTAQAGALTEAEVFQQTLGVGVGTGTPGDRWRFATIPRDDAAQAVSGTSGSGSAAVDFSVSAYGITDPGGGTSTANLGTLVLNSRGLARPILDTNADN